MFAKAEIDAHRNRNQDNYSKNSATHNELINSTLLLAYRDISQLLKRHLFDKFPKDHYSLLDFGCGAGLSTELYVKEILDVEKTVSVTGVDISEENLLYARKRLPKGNFIKIPAEASLDLGQFDIIVCNFVLVEVRYPEMVSILKSLQKSLNPEGILIVTNCSSKVYRRDLKWNSFNGNFPENEPTVERKGMKKLVEDQPIKVELIISEDKDTGIVKSFNFFDFFHPGRQYKKAYEESGLQLLETHKPMGSLADGVAWKSELRYSPYKIHVLKNTIEKSFDLEEAISDVLSPGR
jgi:ubiquinone/menaquinone biosynthesis C-methylase UbiE